MASRRVAANVRVVWMRSQIHSEECYPDDHLRGWNHGYIYSGGLQGQPSPSHVAEMRILPPHQLGLGCLDFFHGAIAVSEETNKRTLA